MLETPCPNAPEQTEAQFGDSRAHHGVQRVFLDAAVFELPTQAAQRTSADLSSTLVADPAVRLLGTPHLMAEAERSTMMVEERTGVVTTSSLNALSASATFTEEQRTVLDLEIVLQVPIAQDSMSGELTAPKRRIRMLLAPRDRQQVRSSAPIPGLPGRSLLVLLKPYFIHDDTDLHAVFQCKMRQRQRALDPE